jgi:hypothetical protein
LRIVLADFRANASRLSRHRPITFALAVVATVLLVSLGGCGGSGSSRYVDRAYGFSFKIPAGWQAPNSGKHGITSDGIPGYTLQFIKPAGFHVVVDSSRPNFSSIPNGRIVTGKPQAGCPSFCVYYQIKVSHRPALLVRKLDATRHLYEEVVFVNSRRWGYDIALASAGTLPNSQDKQFGQVVSTFRIGPRG